MGLPNSLSLFIKTFLAEFRLSCSFGSLSSGPEGLQREVSGTAGSLRVRQKKDRADQQEPCSGQKEGTCGRQEAYKGRFIFKQHIKKQGQAK